NVHEYLTTIGDHVRSGKTKLDGFIINERLGKNPEDYTDGKSQLHVQVALRQKAKGGRHPDEVRRSNLHVDYEYCISKSYRLLSDCDPIEGTDRPRLAECLVWTFNDIAT
ncbi:hypothetical protein AX14_005348, partial [Amanita brunnescens Koide BX004]